MNGVDPIEFAGLIQADYRGDSPLATVATCDDGAVQACVVLHWGLRVLLIRGTDQRIDWKYNLALRPRSMVPKRGHQFWWHGGFLRQTLIVCAWAKQFMPLDFVIGHSLGGAVAQIVGVSEGYAQVPTVTFGAPRPAWLRDPDPPPENVMNYCRRDDFVTKVPPWILGYRHVGAVSHLPVPWQVGETHRIEHYVQALRNR